MCHSYFDLCYTYYLVISKYINLTKFCTLTTDLRSLTLRMSLSQTDKLTHILSLLSYRKPTANWRIRFYRQHMMLETGTLPVSFWPIPPSLKKVESQERPMSCFMNKIIPIKFYIFSCNLWYLQNSTNSPQK